MTTSSKEQVVTTMRERIRIAIASEIYEEIQEQEALSASQCADIAIAAIAEAVWADPLAISAHAKLDAIIARITC